MKRLGHFYKEKLQDEFKKRFEVSNNFLVVSYLGTSAPDFSTLRSNLRRAGAETLVFKNTLLRKVLKEKELDELTGLIDGPIAFVLGFDDPVLVSKVLVDFSKEHKSINLRGGFLGDSLVDYNELKRISELPCEEILKYMLCNCLISPIRGFVSLLHNNIRQFLCLLNQIVEKRG